VNFQLSLNRSNHVDREPVACAHCRKPVYSSATDPGISVFCCTGCETVYQLLQSTGLTAYYDLRDRAGGETKRVSETIPDLRYLDDPTFREKFEKQLDGLKRPEMDFFVEGVHCAACIWLIEKLPDLVPGVESCRLDFGRSVATIRLKDRGLFSEAAQKLFWLGYRPHAIADDNEAAELKKKENRAWLTKIGVAGACTGNIMLLAAALYSGVEEPYANIFRWLSGLLFAPVLFYSASSFFWNSVSALRSRSLSIDVPVFFAIVFGSAVSVWNLQTAGAHIYFDSLAMLIFLLLASRYTLRRIQQKNLGGSHLYHFIAPSRAKRFNAANGECSFVNADVLVAGDILIVEDGEVFPVDGRVIEGASHVNLALLTGESNLQKIGPGDSVFAGTVNQGTALKVHTVKVGKQTRFGQILAQIEAGEMTKTPIVMAADRVAKWFLAAVCLIAVGVFWLTPGFDAALSRSLALIIVTCPCALALATPLAMSLALKNASKNGVLIHNAEVIERLSKVRNVLFDKTGTITQGKYQVLDWATDWGAFASVASVVRALEQKSKHPVALALVEYLDSRSPAGIDGSATIALVEQFEERLGIGVSGYVGDQYCEVRALPEQAEQVEASLQTTKQPVTRVGVFMNKKLVARIALGDGVRPGAADAIRALQSTGHRAFLVSGDSVETCTVVGRSVGLPQGQIFGRLSPEQKADLAGKLNPCALVGDGANDALGLKVASVGIAVHGAVDISLRVAGVYVSKPGLDYVSGLFRLAHGTMVLIRRNFAFSLAYNVAAGALAISGHMTPLLAALFMPVSAFTVFASTLYSSQKNEKIAFKKMQLEART